MRAVLRSSTLTMQITWFMNSSFYASRLCDRSMVVQTDLH